MPALKTINYRGGLVSFSLPETWQEEYDPKGGATFYEDDPDSGTLRLDVVTMEAPPGVRELSAAQALADAGEKSDGRQIATLPNGQAIANYVQTATEDGQPLRIHYWEVACPLPPRHIRVAIFSYSVLAKTASDRAVKEELELLGRLIAEAEFSQELGVLPSAERKPWWRFW